MGLGGQNVRIMRISQEILLSLLHLPEGTEIVDVNTTRMFEYGELELKIRHRDFSQVAPNHQVPLVCPTYSSVDETLTKRTVKFEGWHGTPASLQHRGCGLVE